jgi:hypothetical protein
VPWDSGTDIENPAKIVLWDMGQCRFDRNGTVSANLF